jgi:hypothetical protein
MQALSSRTQGVAGSDAAIDGASNPARPGASDST